MINRIIALLLIIIFVPVFLFICLVIYIEDGAPAFFSQKRVGADLKIFHIYKFRTMKRETPNIATHLLTSPEKYILKCGRILRKLSLDELPNLFNILKGEMVFIGPRPALFNQNDLMELRKIEGVYKFKPGITGWAQINGRDNISIEEKVRLEKQYLEKKTFLLDIKIIIFTFFSVFTGKGVKH